MMVYRGRVENGVIRLDDSATLPEGAQVEVRLIGRPDQPHEAPAANLYERLRPVIGTAEGLPPDASANVDHYLYGRPKK